MRIDSCFASRGEAIRGTKAPLKITKTLELFDVRYWSFDGKLHKGQVVMREDRVRDIKDAFKLMVELRFPVGKVIPIIQYGWDDEASMADNNSSGFCYRLIIEKDQLSNHSFGTAFDLNPRQNPFRSRSGTIYPPGAVRDLSAPGTLLPDGEIVRFFKERGWTYGGDWTSVKDYHHFEKL